MNPSLRFIYLFCNDLNEMREFYTNIIQLKEIYFAPSESVAYQCDKLQISFTQVDKKLPVSSGWAIQPGWKGGDLPITSWSIECGEQDFKKVVKRLQEKKVESFTKEPVWNGYWSFVVKDPAGNTVELSFPGERNASVTEASNDRF